MAWYQGFLKKVYETPEFKEYMEQGRAQGRASPPGPSTSSGWRRAEQLHKDLMAKGGLLKK